MRLNWQAVFLSISLLTRLQRTITITRQEKNMMRHWRCAIVGAGLLAAVSTGAGASGFNYSYAEIGYSNINSDPLDAKGGTAELSIAAGDYVHLKGSYSRFNNADLTKSTGFPFSGKETVSVDVDSYSVGIGGNYPVHKKIDLTGTLSYLDNEFSGNSNNSDRGYELEVGARVQALKKLEMTPSIVKVNVDNYDDTGYSLGLVYALNKKFSLRTRVRKFSDNDVTDFFAGVRLNF
jgi:hypothetical protein